MATYIWRRSVHRRGWLAGLLCGAWFAGGWLPLVASAALTERVSVDSLGTQGSDFGDSFHPALSADGRVVAFESFANNLVAGDSNGASHIFVHDRQSGQTTRVSISSTGAQGNNNSFRPVLSADGRFVAFESVASNLVPGDSNGVRDIFVHDRQSGQTTRVSVSSAGQQGNRSSAHPALSADGRFVAFESWSNLVPEDTNDVEDIFVHDRQSGETTRVSVSSTGAQVNSSSFDPALSADGRFVAFTSYASHLVAGDGNQGTAIFVHDRQTGVTTRLSVDSAGTQANASSLNPTLSADGRVVVFDSDASNLVPGDTNSAFDIFVHEREGLGECVATVMSLEPERVWCHNLSSGQQAGVDPEGAMVWDCVAVGLAIAPGDKVVAGAHGVATGLTDVEGTISGLAPILAACTNLTTGQRVEQLMDDATTWNCGAMGLVVLAGEEVRTNVRGFVE